MNRKFEAFDALQMSMATFQRSLQGVLDLVDLLEEVDTKLEHKRGLNSIYERVATTLPREKRQELKNLIEATTPLFLAFTLGVYARSAKREDSGNQNWESISAVELLPDDLPEEIRELARPHIELPEGCSILTGDDRLRVEIEDRQLRRAFFDVLDEHSMTRMAPDHGEIMQRSLLVTAVSAFEQLISDVYRVALIASPGQLKKADFNFSLSEIMDFSTIDEAVEEAISRQVDAFSRKGLAEWGKWFKERELKIDLESLADDWSRVREVIERRNVFVHRGGQISKQYLRNVDERLRSGLAEGDRISVEGGYLAEAIDQLLSLGVCLVATYCARALGEELAEDLVNDVTSLQYALLKADRHRPVITLSAAIQDLKIDTSTKLVFKVNAWIAATRLGKNDEVAREVANWDVSALAERFRLAKTVLSGDLERAKRAIGDLLATGSIEVHELADWPLLSQMRELGMMDEYLSEPSALEWNPAP